MRRDGRVGREGRVGKGREGKVGTVGRVSGNVDKGWGGWWEGEDMWSGG